MKIKENGRSMVEMLGVLAIIGVLSAGAMAGYSKAMFRHRVNQTIDIFQGVLQRFSELEQKDWGGVCLGLDGGNGANGIAEDMVKYDLLPECQETSGEFWEGTGCKLPIGVLEFDACQSHGVTGALFSISMYDSKSCVAFLSAGWESTLPTEWVYHSNTALFGNNSDENGIFVCPQEGCGDTKYIYVPNKEKLTYTMSDITEACHICDEEGTCEIMFQFGFAF